MKDLKLFFDVLALFVMFGMVSCSGNKNNERADDTTIKVDEIANQVAEVSEKDSISKLIYQLYYDDPNQMDEMYDAETPAYMPAMKEQFKKYGINSHLAGPDDTYFTESFIKSHPFPKDELWQGSDHMAIKMDIIIENIEFKTPNDATVIIKDGENGNPIKIQLLRDSERWKVNSIEYE